MKIKNSSVAVGLLVELSMPADASAFQIGAAGCTRLLLWMMRSSALRRAPHTR
jgi:hypothetical protein